jgi:hypothetical protein
MQVGNVDDDAHLFRGLLWNHDAQGVWPNSVIERRLHPAHFPICRYEHSRLAHLDRRLLHTKSIKVFGLFDAAEQRAQTEPEEPQPTGAMREIQTEIAGVETTPPAQIEAGDLILVVAYEEESGSPIELRAFENTTASPPSITDMQEFVVPKSMPKTFAINCSPFVQAARCGVASL